jgi:hypothetical protein
VVSLNNAGEVAFRWNLTHGSSVNPTNDAAIWSGRPDTLRLVARKGDVPPRGVGAITEFGDPVINATGDVAFQVTLGDEASAIVAEQSGQLEVLARTGDVAPDAPTGAVFDVFHSDQSPLVNGAGQIAFSALLAQGEGGVDEQNDFGLWATDVTGNLRLVVRESDVIYVDSGPGFDLRVVSNFSTYDDVNVFGQGTSNQDGRPSFFSGRGQIAFWAQFTDGSTGVFLSNVVAIPEPTSVSLLAIALLYLYPSVRIRRRPSAWQVTSQP